MCEEHKKYQAKNKPGSPCLECWIEWCFMHQKETIQAKDLLSILEIIYCIEHFGTAYDRRHLKDLEKSLGEKEIQANSKDSRD